MSDRLSKKFKTTIVAAMVLGLTGCGITPPNYYTGANVTNKIDSVDIFVTVPQKEIRADVDQSNAAAAMGGGLIFALIDAAVEHSRANTAEKLIQPVKDALVEVDFNTELKAALAIELKEVSWLNVDDIVLVNDIDQQTRENSYGEADAEAVLFVDANYAITADFTSFRANATSSILPKSDELKQFSEKPDSKYALSGAWNMDNNIYRDNINVSHSVVSGHSPEERASLMAEDPENVRAKLKETAAALAKAIAKSLVRNGTAENINKVS